MEVWTEWLDYVPIIGTVKDAVEAVSALCLGDIARAEEKGAMAIIGGTLDAFTGGMGHVADTLIIKGLAKDVAVEAIGKRALKTTASSASGAVKSHIRNDLIPKLESHTPFSNLKKGEKKLSKRGEHVINNNVLKVFKNIIDRFCDKNECRLEPGTKVYEAYHNPLPPSVTHSISKVMVADMRVSIHYIDANSTLYGEAIKNLSNAVLLYMRTCLQALQSGQSSSLPMMEREIFERVRQLNSNELYVDEVAKACWLQEGGSEAVFRQARDEVVRMFQRLTYHYGGDEVIQWVKELHNL